MDISNILALLDIAIGIGILVILGIKYVAGSCEEKAEYRKVFSPYVIFTVLSFMSAGLLQFPFAKRPSWSVIIALMPFIFPIAISQDFLLRKYAVHMLDKLKKQGADSFTDESNDLIAKLLIQKNGKNLVTYSPLFLSFFIEYVAYLKKAETVSFFVMLLAFSLIILNFINQQVLYYRIKHGLYGTCYSEAKEIVSFILEWHRKNGDSNGKPPKLVFTKEELEERLQVNGGEEYA